MVMAIHFSVMRSALRLAACLWSKGASSMQISVRVVHSSRSSAATDCHPRCPKLCALTSCCSSLWLKVMVHGLHIVPWQVGLHGVLNTVIILRHVRVCSEQVACFKQVPSQGLGHVALCLHATACHLAHKMEEDAEQADRPLLFTLSSIVGTGPPRAAQVGEESWVGSQ